MKLSSVLKLLLAIALCELAGIIGSVFTFSAIPTWYATLQRPFLSPPNWLFGPVWTLLYLLMGVALFLVWQKWPAAAASVGNQSAAMLKRKIKIALAIFGVQLVLNALWSVIFFGLRSPGAALVEIIFLWLAILASIVLFFKISRPAGYLLIPYILWVSFASYLNLMIWLINY